MAVAGAWYTKQEGDTADALGLEDEPTRSASCELAEIEPLHYLRAAIGCRLSGAHRPVRAPSSRCRTGHYLRRSLVWASFTRVRAATNTR